MQVNSCTQTPNFCRLMVTKEAYPALKECPAKTIERLCKAGEDLKYSTEYFDIEVGKNLSCKIKGLKDKYFGVFKSNVFKNIRQGLNENLLEIDHYTVSRNLVCDNSDEIVLNVISSKNFSGIENAEHIEELVAITKELDAAAVGHEQRDLQTMVDRKYARKLRDELMDNFGV